MKSLFTPSLSDLSLSISLHLYPYLTKPSVSSSESVWLLKLKEQQSVPTQIVTHTHTHRQSTLDKYMINCFRTTVLVRSCFYNKEYTVLIRSTTLQRTKQSCYRKNTTSGINFPYVQMINLSYIYLGSSVCLSSCHIPVVLSYLRNAELFFMLK